MFPFVTGIGEIRGAAMLAEIAKLRTGAAGGRDGPNSAALPPSARAEWTFTITTNDLIQCRRRSDPTIASRTCGAAWRAGLFARAARSAAHRRCRCAAK
jgi:hypothetical protein